MLGTLGREARSEPVSSGIAVGSQQGPGPTAWPSVEQESLGCHSGSVEGEEGSERGRKGTSGPRVCREGVGRGGPRRGFREWEE